MQRKRNSDAYRAFFLIVCVAQERQRWSELFIPKELIEAWGFEERTFRRSLDLLSDEWLIRFRRIPREPELFDLWCVEPADPANPFRVDLSAMPDDLHAYYKITEDLSRLIDDVSVLVKRSIG